MILEELSGNAILLVSYNESNKRGFVGPGNRLENVICNPFKELTMLKAGDNQPWERTLGWEAALAPYWSCAVSFSSLPFSVSL